MAKTEPVWDDYVFSYTNDEDGIHIEHNKCDKEISPPESWLTAGLAKGLIEEHATRCIKRKRRIDG